MNKIIFVLIFILALAAVSLGRDKELEKSVDFVCRKLRSILSTRVYGVSFSIALLREDQLYTSSKTLVFA